MPGWKKLLSRSFSSPQELAPHFDLDKTALQKVTARYPMRINPYYFSLIKTPGDPLYKQAVPDAREIEDPAGEEDPLGEEALSPCPGLTHKYPDRVLLLVSNQCAMYCRFCNRKRKVGRPGLVDRKTIRAGLAYIRGHKEIRDVLLSGGDPLLLSDPELHALLTELRAIAHVAVVRIGSRVPCTLPQRITPALVRVLKAFHPLYLNTQFNHPSEITPQAAAACGRLADAGIGLGCQTVLLKGINDDSSVMFALMEKLIEIRVRPYYLFQADLARGTAHFWTPVATGLKIMRRLQGRLSGLCLPHYVIDLPGGGGKVPLLPSYLRQTKKGVTFINYLGREYTYPVELLEGLGEEGL
ncbi:MAG: KamA family radical SAM protein [Desulfobacteraceae bacterium]|nr:MAG: KamA family radical SAM protein [Desulfobacteraceae bacterium]